MVPNFGERLSVRREEGDLGVRDTRIRIRIDDSTVQLHGRDVTRRLADGRVHARCARRCVDRNHLVWCSRTRLERGWLQARRGIHGRSLRRVPAHEEQGEEREDKRRNADKELGAHEETSDDSSATHGTLRERRFRDDLGFDLRQPTARLGEEHRAREDAGG